MNRAVHIAARLIVAAQKASARKWSFLAVAAVCFFGSVTLLARLDLLPEARTNVSETTVPAVTLAASPLVAGAGALATNAVAESPDKIEIPSIKLVTTVSNPDSTQIDVLDRALLTGAVRYPSSAKLGETGNVVIFGHSSYLPVVNNQAFKAFTGIEKLHAGDTIIVYSSSRVHTYAVRSVTKEDANSAGIPLTVAGKVLTLSTCNSFGEKSDRFVVVADFVESHPISG